MFWVSLDKHRFDLGSTRQVKWIHKWEACDGNENAHHISAHTLITIVAGSLCSFSFISSLVFQIVEFCHDQFVLWFFLFLFSPPKNDSFQKDFCFAVVFFLFFFSPRVISELRGPIAAKFCTMLLSTFNFTIPVQNFRGASPKNF